MRPTVQLIALTFVGLGVVACAPQPTATQAAPVGEIGQPVPVEGGGQYTDILPKELEPMLAQKDFFFVNVHVPFEGDIPDTDASIAFDEVGDRLDEFPPEKDAKIVVYCRSGSMSAIAAQALVHAGYTNVYNLDGGFRAWQAAGYELITEK